jgi:hypothetical protein
MRVTVWESRRGVYREMDEAASLPLDATEDKSLGRVVRKQLEEQGTKWSVTIMQERLFPPAPARPLQPQRLEKYPYVIGSAAHGPFHMSNNVRVKSPNARRLPCLFERYFYVHIITCSKDSAFVLLFRVSIKSLEGGGVR